MRRWSLFLAAALLLLGAAWWRLGRPRTAGVRHVASPAYLSAGAASPSWSPPARAIPSLAENGGDAPSHLADDLNSSRSDIHADLRLINEILIHYRSAVHGDNPVGENAEITAALSGQNRLEFAFIPPDHPAISGQGELCDRWGTPFFFHQISAQEMEIRSAGPDRKMYTGDDEVLTPGNE